MSLKHPSLHLFNSDHFYNHVRQKRRSPLSLHFTLIVALMHYLNVRDYYFVYPYLRNCCSFKAFYLYSAFSSNFFCFQTPLVLFWKCSGDHRNDHSSRANRVANFMHILCQKASFPALFSIKNKQPKKRVAY